VKQDNRLPFESISVFDVASSLLKELFFLLCPRRRAGVKDRQDRKKGIMSVRESSHAREKNSSPQSQGGSKTLTQRI
jgi:hypothetical protein